MSLPTSNLDESASRNEERLEDLLATAKVGSASALGRALDICRPRLLRVARRAVGRQLRPRVGASDVVQDTFVNATRAFGLFRGRRSREFLGWLYSILSNRVAQIARRDAHARKYALHRIDGDPPAVWLSNYTDGDPSPSSIACDQEYSALIRLGLTRLSPRDQQVLRLRFDDGLTHSQIGAILGLTEDGARMLFSRAVERLKREMPREPAL